MILDFFEEEQRKVDAGILDLENALLGDDLQEDDPQIPNFVLDQYLRILNASELKMLLVIIRETNGRMDARIGKRKTRDRISHSQFKERKDRSLL